VLVGEGNGEKEESAQYDEKARILGWLLGRSADQDGGVSRRRRWVGRRGEFLGDDELEVLRKIGFFIRMGG
jgi:hypothetical protein